MKTRVCKKCGKREPLSAFHSERLGEGPKAVTCSTCRGKVNAYNVRRKRTRHSTSRIPASHKLNVRPTLLLLESELRDRLLYTRGAIDQATGKAERTLCDTEIRTRLAVAKGIDRE